MKKTHKGNRRHLATMSLNRAKVTLTKSANPSKALSDARRFVPASLYSALLSWIREIPVINARTLGSPFPAIPRVWKSISVPAPIRPSDEFIWCRSFLRPHVGLIGEFVRRSQLIERAFLFLRHEEFGRQLELVRKDFGLSLWWLKRKLVHLQQTEGLEAQKKFAVEIQRNEEFMGRMIPYLCYYLSYRTEITVLPSRFELQYRTTVSDYQLSTGLKAYICHHVISGSVKSLEDIASVLRFESNGSVIDYYETFISMCQMVVVGHFVELFKPLLKICIEFAAVIEDPRLMRLLYELGIDKLDKIMPDLDDIQVYDLFLKGEYEKAFDRGIAMIGSHETNPGTVLVTALSKSRSHSYKGDSKGLDAELSIVQLLAAAVAGDELSGDAKSDLIRFKWATQGAPLSHLAGAVLKRESSSAPLVPDLLGTSYDSIGMVRFHPAFTDLLGISDINSRIAVLFRQKGGNPNQTVSDSQITENTSKETTFNMAFDANNLLSAQQLIRGGMEEDALALGEALLTSEVPFYRRNGVRIVTHCLWKTERAADFVRAIVDFYLEDSKIIGILPLETIVPLLEGERRQSLVHLVSYAILCDMYVLHNGNSAQHLRSYACEDFLIAHSLKRPSQVNILIGKCDVRQLVYFLREICTEQVMDTWMEFQSSQDVARERVEICRLLIKIDAKNSDQYQGEIKDIMRRLAIGAKLREIEQSKIYIDTESVKNVAKRELKESYSRYISFLQSGMSSKDMAILETTKKLFSEGDYEGLLSLELPRNEMIALMESMVIRLRDEFVSSSQHGLDGYLSVRIRHGTLAGQLRAPLEKENLLTSKDPRTNRRKPNDVWISRLHKGEDPVRGELTKAFESFSNSFDELIETIRRDWLQVRKDSQGVGLFDFRILSPEIGYFSTLVDADTPLERFIDKVVDYFVVEKLGPSLDRIRKMLQKEAKHNVNKMLMLLQGSVENSVVAVDVWQLRAAIGRAGTNMQVTLDRIIEWFHLSREAQREPFSVEDAVNISAKSIKIFRPEFEWSLESSSELEDFRIQGNLASFVDILFLMFENIVRHCGASVKPAAIVRADLRESELVVRVENKVGKEVTTVTAREEVEKTRMAVKQQPYSKSVSREGGTGFYKLQKILHHDFRLNQADKNPEFDFGFEDGDIFFVEIHIPVRYEKLMEGK